VTTVILDQPWQIYMFGMAQLKGRLELEVNTILKFRNSHLGTTLQAANHVMGTNFKRKADALEEFTKRYEMAKAFYGI
jgi:hypothetical protein